MTEKNHWEKFEVAWLKTTFGSLSHLVHIPIKQSTSPDRSFLANKDKKIEKYDDEYFKEKNWIDNFIILQYLNA